MSVMFMSAVFEHSQAKYGDRLVLLAIADNTGDEKGTAWPSIAKLASKSHLSIRQTQRAIANLVALGELGVEHGKGPKGCNLFTLLIGGDILSGGDTHVAEGVTPMSQGGDTDVIRTIIEPSEEPSEEEHPLPPQGGNGQFPKRPARKTNPFPAHCAELPFPSSEKFRAAWLDWCCLRAEIGKPLTETAVKRQLLKCQEWGEHRAVAALENSTANSYQGLFEPNGQKPTQPNHDPENYRFNIS